MAEMTAVEFLKEYGRMCKMNELDCLGCQLSEFKRKYNNMTCRSGIIEHPEEAVSIVQEWAEEHPQKTMLQDFFEKHPKAPRKTSGDPICCIVTLGYKTDDMECCNNCVECWNRPLEEGEEG